MKFSSSGYPSNKKTNPNTPRSTESVRSTSDNYSSNNKDRPKVKIPNYTTPSDSNKKSSATPPKYNNTSTPYTYNNPVSNGPVGVPMMPLYGYDNYDDAEKDWGYFRQLYPSAAARIMREVDEECDKLEYDGSCMYDEYPDKVFLGRIVDRIYNKVKDDIQEPVVYGESLNPPSTTEDYANLENSTLDTSQKENTLNINQYRRGNNQSQIRSNNWLRDLVEILLYQEMLNRRGRYRSRRRWF